MTAKELHETLDKNIAVALAAGFTLKHDFGCFHKKTCCAVSANCFMHDGRGGWIGVAEKEKQLNLPQNALWQVISGFDAVTLPPPKYNTKFYAIGMALRKKYLK